MIPVGKNNANVNWDVGTGVTEGSITVTILEGGRDENGNPISIERTIKNDAYSAPGFNANSNRFLPEQDFYIAFDYNAILGTLDMKNFDGSDKSKFDAGSGGYISLLYDAVKTKGVPAQYGKRNKNKVVENTPVDIEFNKRIDDGKETEQYLVYGIQKECKILFQFFDDKGVTIKDRTPSYTPVQMFSRFEPIQMWSQGSALTVDLIIKYIATDPVKYNELWVDRMAGLFKALSQPNYPGGASYTAPPVLRLKLGDLVDDLPCVVTSFSRSWDDRQYTIGEGTQGSTGNTMYQYVRPNASSAPEKQKSSSANGVVNGLFLPKIQTFNLTLTSSYPVHSQVDFMTAVGRNEGVNLLKGIKLK